MRILLVDDDAMAGEMTGAILEDLGYQVVLAENGVDAASIFSDPEEFDMVISDMNMPMISGIDLFHEFREQGINIPFILLTGDNVEDMLIQEPNLDACLMKDYNLEESLPKVISEVLARYGRI
jgi:CheY-like chemotaxis protein